MMGGSHPIGGNNRRKCTVTVVIEGSVAALAGGDPV